MALPNFTDVLKAPNFQALSDSEKEATANRYWDAYERDNPQDVTFAQEQRADSIKLLKNRTNLEDVVPFERRARDLNIEDAKFNLALREGVKNGTIDTERARTLEEGYISSSSASRERANKTTSFDPNVFADLGEFASEGAVFTPERLASRLGMTDRTTEEQRSAYESTRASVAENSGLEESEIDDVVKHLLQAQEKDISRDSLGKVHIKNNVLFEGKEGIKKAINSSDLPESVKASEISNLENTFGDFQRNVVATTIKDHPEFAKQFKLNADDIQGSYDKIIKEASSSKTKTAVGSLLSAGFAGVGGATYVAGLFGEKLPVVGDSIKEATDRTSGDLEEASQAIDSVIQLGDIINKEKLKAFGNTQFSTLSQGATSIIESALLARATSRLIPELAGTGRLVGAINNMSKVAPTAATFGIRQGADTYRDALKKGMSEDDAFRAGLLSAAIEAGVTTIASGVGAGGVESMAANAGREAISKTAKSAVAEAFKGSAKTLLGEQAEENLITALDTALVQTQLNPNMTVEDFKQALIDTAAATLVGSAGPTAVGAVATYQQTNEQLRQRANDLYSQEDLPQIETERGTVTPPSEAPVGRGELETQRAELEASLEGLQGDERIAVQEAIQDIDDELGALPSNEVVTEPQISEETVTPEIETPVEQQPTLQPNEESQTETQVEQAQAEEILTPETPQDTVTEPETEPVTETETETVSEPTPVSEPTLVSEPTPVSEPASAPETTPAAVVSETEIALNEEEPIGPRKSINTALRRRFGLTDPTVRLPQSTREAVEKADAEIKANPSRGRELVVSLQGSGRIANATETAILSHELSKSVNRLESAEQAFNRPSEDPLVLRDRQIEYENALADFNTISNLISQNASEASFRLNAQKILRRKDYSFAGMLTRAQAAKNKGATTKQDLTKSETAEIQREAKRYEEAEEELQIAVQEAYARGRMDAEKEALSKERKPKRSAVRSKRTNQQKIEDLERDRKAAWDRIKARQKDRLEGGKLFSTIAPFEEADVVDAAIIASSYIRQGVVNLADFTKRLVNDFGENVEPFAQQVFDEAQRLLNGIRRSNEQIVAEATSVTPKDVKEMVRNVVESGVDRNKVIDTVTTELRKKFPETTRDQVSDAYTGYGKPQTNTRSATQKALSDLRQAERLTRQIQDLESGKPLPKNKTQKQVDEEIDALRERRNALMKSANVPVPKDPVASAKRRVRTEIDRLQNAVNNNELIQQRTTQTDSELDALREQLSQTRREYNEAFPEQGTQLTPREEEARVIKLLDNQIERAETQQVEDSKRPDFDWWSPEISDRRKRLDDLRNTRNEIRWREQSKEKARKTLDVLDNILTTGNLPENSKKKSKYTPDQQLQVLWDERNEKQKEVNRMRQELGAEDRQVKAAEKSLAEYERRIREKDYAPKPRGKASSERVKEIRAMRDAKRKELDSARNQGRPKKTREDRAVDAIQRNIEKYRQRIKEGNFEKERRSPVESERVKQAQYELEKVKQDFQKKLGEFALKNASTGQKAWRQISGWLEFRKLIVLGLDVMLLRQGIWSLATRPIQTTRNLIKAVSNYSEKDAFALYSALTDPDKSPTAREYNQVKSFKLYSPLEEGFRNKEDIPDWEVLDQISRVPGLGTIANVVKSIERVNRNLHNLIATDTYNTLTSAVRDSPGAPLSKDNIALASNAAMKMVGRGDSPKFDVAVPVLNMALLSTRYYMARFAAVLGSPIWSTRGGYNSDTAKIRFAIARKMYGKLLFNMGAVMSVVAYLMDDEKEREEFLNPRSPKFGVLRWNGGEYEILNSFRPFINIIAHTIMGSGETVGLVEPQRGRGQQDLKSGWTNFFWNRRNINLAFITDTINGEYYGGEPVTIGSSLSQLMNQINLKNDWEILTDDEMSPAQKALSIGLVHFGGGVEPNPDRFLERKKVEK